MPRKGQWERVYTTKGERDVSWFEPLPSVFIQLLATAGLTPQT